MKVVYVKFAQTNEYRTELKEYVYLCDFDEVAVGDTVVIDTPSSGLVCAKITRIGLDNARATKSIVDLVDVKGYEERKKKADRRIEILARLQRMDDERKQVDKFQEIAGLSEEAKALVTELKAM